jgi:hypothetical protein
VVLSAVAFAAGLLMAAPLIRFYLDSGYRLTAEALPLNHMAVAGLLFVIIASMNFTFTLALHAAAANVRRK